ncbi:hypothetical protein B0O99DRAFT_680073 [Bisporella sp. PMI_857]|nr:hypothetical protein B0O99DRAFT_680073 [Bisporella sp. PMI_857]
MAFTRSILITGGTSGLGYQCALILARQNPQYLIIVASRNSQEAHIAINKATSQENTIFLPLDLSSRVKVREFASAFISSDYPPLQVLILNAGLQFPSGVQYTDEGIEKSFAVNHIGGALLFHLLFPALADNARIILVSSAVHDPTKWTMEPKYNTAEELAHPTSLANVLWTYALHQRLNNLPNKKISVVAFNPGLMFGTGLVRDYKDYYPAFVIWVYTYIMPHLVPLARLLLGSNDIMTVEKSGVNLAWLATSPDCEDVSGVYYTERMKAKSSDDSYVEAKQEDLWKWTIAYIATEAEKIEGKFEIGRKQ